MKRLVFMGSDGIALPTLDEMERLCAGRVRLVGVFTQPDRATGRGQRLAANAIKTWALARRLPVHQPERLGAESREQLATLAPDAVLVMAYGHILRQEWLDLPPGGVWNLHASILPALRGASPIQGAIVGGARESGVSLMRMVLELDAGPVLDIERVAVGDFDTAADLEARLAQACVPLLVRNIEHLFEREAALQPQEAAGVTFTRRLRKEDGHLDFYAPAAVLARRINGLYPWPGCTFQLGSETIKVGLAAACDRCAASREAEPGTVLGLVEGGLRVAAQSGQVSLLRLQRPGGRMLDAPEFLRGWPIAAGIRLPSRPMAELVGATPFR